MTYQTKITGQKKLKKLKRLKINSVRRALLRTIKQDIFSRVIKELKANSYYDFGDYKRCYPDNPQSITKGFFQMEINHQYDNTFLFQIEAVEGDFRMNTNYLHFYYIFEDEKALWFHVKDFFSKHTDLESLSQSVYKKFGFLTPKEGSTLFDHYSLLKDDLPDGQTFEDFIEDLDSFLKKN